MSRVYLLAPALWAVLVSAACSDAGGDVDPRDAEVVSAVENVAAPPSPIAEQPTSVARSADAAPPGEEPRVPAAQTSTDAEPPAARQPVTEPPPQANTSTAEAAPSDAILRSAEEAYDKVRSLRADFVQDLSVPLLGSSQRSRGTLYLRRPDRFAMRFSDPSGDVVVADGEHLWMYYPSADRTQVVQAPISEAGGQVDFQSQFLTNASARYDATLLGEERVGGRSAHVLRLVPRQESQYRQVKIWVDERDHLVRRFEITEQNESVRRIELRGLETNLSIPDRTFQFTPPPGTQVFRQ